MKRIVFVLCLVLVASISCKNEAVRGAPATTVSDQQNAELQRQLADTKAQLKAAQQQIAASENETLFRAVQASFADQVGISIKIVQMKAPEKQMLIIAEDEKYRYAYLWTDGIVAELARVPIKK